MSIRKWAKVLHFNLNTISHCCKQWTGIKEHCKSFSEHSFFSTFTYVLTLIFLAYNTRMSWRLAFALQCGHLPPWPFNHLSIQLKFHKENSIFQHIHKKLKTVLNMTWKFHLSWAQFHRNDEHMCSKGAQYCKTVRFHIPVYTSFDYWYLLT